MNFGRLFASIALLAGFTAAVPASAVITAYYDETSFDAATSGLTTYSIPQGPTSDPYPIGSVALIGPVLFFGDLALVGDDAFGTGIPYLGSNGDIGAAVFHGTSIGFHFGTFGTDGDVSITFNEFTSDPVTILPGNQIAFIGFTGLEPLSGFVFDAEGDEIDIIDFKTDGVLPSVPEPATWVLLIGGFGAVGSAMRRRQSLAA